MFLLRSGLSAALLIVVASNVRASDPAPATPLLWSEDFLRSSGNGFPQGWGFGPPAHVPFLASASDHETFGIAAPSLRVDLAPQTLNYRIASPLVPLPDLSAEYTLELSIKLDQPDSPFQIEVVTYDAESRWVKIQTLMGLLGKQDESFRRYRLTFRPDSLERSGYVALHLGLSYAKMFREGTVWIDDVTLREGGNSPPVEAYVTPTTVAPGEGIALHISAGKESARVSFYREGVTRERVLGPFSVEGLTLPTTREEAWRNGAGWPSSLDFTIPEDWPTGAYAAEVDDGDRVTAASFVVHERMPSAPILVILPNHTEQAYNAWGGHSFYTPVPVKEVSFERPLFFPNEYYSAPIHLLRWLSREGIPFAVANDDDLHERPEWIAGYRTLILVGHDEYWTRQMRWSVERHLDRGGVLLALGGNLCWWQTRVETTDGVRRLICYKYSAWEDPYQTIDPTLVTTHWDEPPLNEPPNLFLGLSWREGGAVNWSPSSACPCPYDWLLGFGGYTIANSDHWVFTDTGVSDGDMFGRDAAIVGYEVDGALLRWEGTRPFVTGEGGTSPDFVVLGTSPCFNQYRADSSGVAVMGILERNGGFMFNAGTVGWSFGLAHDPQVQRTTRNLIDRALALGPPDMSRAYLSARPSPASESVTISGSLAGGVPSPPEIGCYDVMGRHIARLAPYSSEGHAFQARWDLRAGNGVAPGVYWIRSGSASARVVVIPRR